MGQERHLAPLADAISVIGINDEGHLHGSEAHQSLIGPSRPSFITTLVGNIGRKIARDRAASLNAQETLSLRTRCALAG